MSVTANSWQCMWRALGAAAADAALFDELVAAYSQKHRHYHTLQHLRECLEQFDAARALARRPAEVECALWFHDAVYDVHADDNEERSAAWARRALLQAGVAEDVAERVHSLIMATQHKQLPDHADARVTVDVDLAILGAPAPRFDESDRQIRQEYAHVPEPEFRAGRCHVLRGFLDRPRIYGTEEFHARFDAQARDNLARALVRWSS